MCLSICSTLGLPSPDTASHPEAALKPVIRKIVRTYIEDKHQRKERSTFARRGTAIFSADVITDSDVVERRRICGVHVVQERVQEAYTRKVINYSQSLKDT